MYTPRHFQEQDPDRIRAFIGENPFGILVGATTGAPEASHLPFAVDGEGETLRLVSHVARANPLAQSFGEEREVLVIFHGPHAYISPSLYDHPHSVPTWNYVAVHVYGRPRRIVDPAETERSLRGMIRRFETGYEERWNSLPADYVDRMMRGIVAFELTVTRWEAQFKLSQNKTEAERSRIAETLAGSDHGAARETGRWMRMTEPERK